jgi:hypothetical protein
VYRRHESAADETGANTPSGRLDAHAAILT